MYEDKDGIMRGARIADKIQKFQKDSYKQQAVRQSSTSLGGKDQHIISH